MITFDLASENLLSILGALYDIVGALVLARGLAFVRARAMIDQAATSWDYSPDLVRVFAEQRIDAWAGLALLLLGFSIQGFAGYGFKTISWHVFASGVVALVAIVGIYLLSRQCLVKRGFVNALRTLLNTDGTPRFSYETIDDAWGKLQLSKKDS